jgi:hypothetical protein
VAAQLADSQEWLIHMELEKSEKIMAGNELGNSLEGGGEVNSLLQDHVFSVFVYGVV